MGGVIGRWGGTRWVNQESGRGRVGGDCEYQCSQAGELGMWPKFPLEVLDRPTVMSLCSGDELRLCVSCCHVTV